MFQLVVAKCWDPNPKDYFSVPRTEPVRPIDPGAWVAHTAAVRGLEIPQYPGGAAGYPGTAVGGVGGVPVGGALRAPSVSTLTSSGPSLASTVQERAGPGGPGSPRPLHYRYYICIDLLSTTRVYVMESDRSPCQAFTWQE